MVIAPERVSTPSGMGSMPIPGDGVGFRLWAPFAQQVFVAGDFNEWSESNNPLGREGTSGNWSTDMPSATVGQQYRYVIHPFHDFVGQ